MITLGMSRKRARYPCDLTDEKWLFFGPCLTLMRQGARRSENPSRKLGSGLRHFVKAGCWWRLPSLWIAASQRCHRWLGEGNFEAMAHDLSEIPRVASDCQERPLQRLLRTVIRCDRLLKEEHAPDTTTIPLSGTRRARRDISRELIYI